MLPEIRHENANRYGLIGVLCFALPALLAVVWLLWPTRGDLTQAFFHYWLACLCCVPPTLWALHILLQGRPVIETSPWGIVLGLWIRRGIPWRNVKDIRLSEVRLDGALKKKWSAGRPYHQSLLVDLHDPGDLFFENWLHGLMHILCLSRRQVRVPLKLVVIANNDQVCSELVERWHSAQNAISGDGCADTGNGSD